MYLIFMSIGILGLVFLVLLYIIKPLRAKVSEKIMSFWNSFFWNGLIQSINISFIK